MSLPQTVYFSISNFWYKLTQPIVQYGITVWYRYPFLTLAFDSMWIRIFCFAEKPWRRYSTSTATWAAWLWTRRRAAVRSLSLRRPPVRAWPPILRPASWSAPLKWNPCSRTDCSLVQRRQTQAQKIIKVERVFKLLMIFVVVVVVAIYKWLIDVRYIWLIDWLSLESRTARYRYRRIHFQYRTGTVISILKRALTILFS